MSRAPIPAGISKLNCIPIVRDANAALGLSLISFELPISSSVLDFIDECRDFVKRLRKVPAHHDISLWKLSTPVSADNPRREHLCRAHLIQGQNVQLLDEGNLLSHYWQTPELEWWHNRGGICAIILIERTGEIPFKIWKSERLPGETDTNLLAPKSSLEIARIQMEEKSAELASEGNPSAASKDFAKMNRAYCNTDQQHNAFIFRGWPLENKRTPPVIFNEVLASVKDKLDGVEESEIIPDPDLLEVSAEYVSAVTKLRLREKKRHEDIKSALTHVFEARPTKIKLASSNSPIPDIAWTTDFFDIQAPIILCEVKNYLGIQGDAIFQVAASYSKIISKNQGNLPSSAKNFNYPVILIGCMGTLLQIYAAVHLDGVLLQKLFVRDFDSVTDIFQLAQVFTILREAMRDLESYYEDASSQEIDMNSKEEFLAHLYPSPQPKFGHQGPFPDLEFWSRVRQNGEPDTQNMGSPDPAVRHNIFFATLKGWKDTGTEGVIKSVEVAVKFTHTYNEQAHKTLSEHSSMKLAPRLFFCDQIRGGLFMVVMERFIAKTLKDERSEARANPNNLQKLATIQQANYAVRNALQILSDNSLVHGNGSTSKILVGFPAKTNQKEPVLRAHPVFTIIGFDFAGEASVDRYFPHLPSKTFPPTITRTNRTIIVARGARMETDHDVMGFAECFVPL